MELFAAGAASLVGWAVIWGHFWAPPSKSSWPAPCCRTAAPRLCDFVQDRLRVRSPWAGGLPAQRAGPIIHATWQAHRSKGRHLREPRHTGAAGLGFPAQPLAGRCLPLHQSDYATGAASGPSSGSLMRSGTRGLQHHFATRRRRAAAACDSDSVRVTRAECAIT